MKDELKAELDKVFAASQDKANRTQARDNEEAEQQAEFLRSFEKKRRDLLVPALQEFAEYIRSRAWQVTIAELEEREPEKDGRGRVSTPGSRAGIELTFARQASQAKGYAQRELPQFAIYCDKAKRDVWFHEKTMGSGHGGSSGSSGRVKLDELTADVVQQRAVAYFKKLMSDVGAL